jgi:hypothetical protein
MNPNTIYPNKSQLQFLREMDRLERLPSNETTIIRADDKAAEECVDLEWLQHPMRPHLYRLTASGREVLARYQDVDI